MRVKVPECGVMNVVMFPPLTITLKMLCCHFDELRNGREFTLEEEPLGKFVESNF